MKGAAAVEARRSRVPVQERSQRRIEAALAAAERFLAEVGPERTSIPEIAQIAGIPRATIYQYFPDKYALFARVAEGHLERLAAHIAITTTSNDHLDWRSFIRMAIQSAADYYNANKAAAVLLLTGPFSSLDQGAKSAKDLELARQFRALLMRDGRLERLPKTPDVVALAIEMAFACLKYGYILEGSMSKAITEEATLATLHYLARWE